MTGTDGRIYSTWWDAARLGRLVPGLRRRGRSGSPITAMARNPDHLDLFVTGTDGRIYSSWWDAATGWAGWFNVSGGAAALGSPITAVARNPDHLDLFVTGTDGRIYSTWWDAATGWAGWFNVSGGAAARVAHHRDRAQSRSPGPVRDRHRRPDLLQLVGRRHRLGRLVQRVRRAAALGSPITAIARNPDHLDLFVTGTDGRIYSSWWDAATGWAGWFNVSGGAAALGSPINAVARNPDHLDLFVTGTDGRIYSSWWDAATGWADWFNVSGGRRRWLRPSTPWPDTPITWTCSSPEPTG